MQAHAQPQTTPAKRPHPPWQAQSLLHGVRAKLKLGGAQDEAEKQADRVAAQALNKTVPASGDLAGFSAAANGRAAVRRALTLVKDEKAAAGIEEEQALPDSLEREVSALQGGGQPLPPPVRHDMEARFGMDFTGVRIHTDGQAAGLNEALHAHAFTIGEHIAFNEGRFQPESGPGRFLLAHELAHVAQQRGEAGNLENRPVRRGFWSDLYDTAANSLGDIANWGADKIREFGWRLLESISPEFARKVRAIVDEGILPWLGRQVARAWDAYIATLRALVPFDGPRQLIDLFAGLVERAARIVVALASGNCEPLMAAISELKTFVTETVGVAWDRLTEFLRPVGEFFADLWSNFGAPAVRWLQQFGGDVWEGIQTLGREFWEWIRPVREAAERIWNWFKELLFGPAEGEDSTGSQGGVLGWISRKAGESWDWVREETRPVWQPVADFAGQVAELIPPAFVREMGEHAQQLSSELNNTAEGMDGGEGVPQSRDSLASILPSVQAVIATVRRIIVGAGRWLGERIAAVASTVTGLMTRLSASSLLSWLSSAFNWLSEAVNSLLAWAREKVAVLFDWLVQGFDALTPFLQLVLETVRKVISIYADLLQLPLLVLNSIWQRVPACIRNPIEEFVKTQILARIPAFGQFFTNPELWPRVQQTAMNILRRIFVDGDIPGAAWAFFQAVLRILGIPAQLIVQILAKAARAIGEILTNPIGFLINTLRAVRSGFGRFFDHIGTHLLNGVTGWLFGQLREAGVTPPADFSLRSVLGFVFDVLGITVENIFQRLADKVSPAVVARLRQMMNFASGVWNFVVVLVNEGPAGLWREIQERLSNLWDTVVQGVIGWITEVVINRVSRWLLSLLDPSGIMAVVNSLVAIYNAIESFVEYLRQMLEIVNRVLDGILDIARGAIDGAAGYLESALGSAMPVAIGFLANQLGLGRLSTRIREILQRVQGVVNSAIDWLIDRAIRLGQALLDMARRGVAAVRGAVGRLRDWWRERVNFAGQDGRAHHLYFRGEGANAELIIESTPMGFQTFLNGLPATANSSDKAEAQRLYDELRRIQRIPPPAPSTAAPGGAAGTPTGAGIPANDAEILRLTHELGTVAARLVSAGSAPPSTPPVYGALSNGFSSSVEVNTLTSNSPPGSEPSVDSELWNRLKRRKVGNGSYYIRGHLLNHHIGGSGATWANLTPITGSANTTMSSNIEEKAKTAVEAGTQLDYKVEAKYPRPLGKNQALLDQINGLAAAGPLPAELAAKKEVIEAERSLPERLECTMHKIGYFGSTTPEPVFTDKTNYPVANTIRDDSLDQYDIEGVAYDPNAELSALTKEAEDKTVDPMTWTAFSRTRATRIQHMESRGVSVDPVRRIVDGRIAFKEESDRIANELNRLTTWTAFQAGRTAYGSASPLSSQQLNELEQEFNTKSDSLRASKTQDKINAAQASPASMTWGEFQRANDITRRDGGFTDANVQAIRTAFDGRTASGASGAATPPP